MQSDFEQVIQENQGRIRFIVSRYSDQEEFDDLYQEILMQLWRSFSSFQAQSARETWVYKIALNTACTYVKKTIKHRDVKQSALQVKLADQQHVSEEACQGEILHSFMNQLNETDASVLMMYLDGLPSESIADVIGISANAVRSRVKRIKIEFENNYVGEA